MNTLSENLKNILILVKPPGHLRDLYKLCLERVKKGNLVVLVTSQYYDFSKLLTELAIHKDELNNFIIMCFETIDDVSRKLLSLHNWSLMPSMIVIDLSQLLCNEIKSLTAPLMQKVALCAASLLAYSDSIAINSQNSVYGLLVLQTETEKFSYTQIETLKDLYFYNADLYKNIDGIRTLIQAAEQ